jgi:hypothetical protein
VNVDLVTTDVIVRDSKSDQFIADLKPATSTSSKTA